jgi:hypothetical protein
MRVLAPAYLVAAAIAVAGITVLHLIVTRNPPVDVLPTARFIPLRRSMIRTMRRTPVDRLLLALRVATALLIGLAFARPRLSAHRVPNVSIVAVDRSNAVADAAEASDSARVWLGHFSSNHRVVTDRPTGVLITFDSTAAVVDEREASATLSSLRTSTARGSITSGVIAAVRAASLRRDQADSIELTIVSPVRSDEVDAALDRLRTLWPGPIRLVRVASRPRDALDEGRKPQIDWPRDGHPSGATTRPRPDTVGAVAAGAVVVVAPFVRRWLPDTTHARIVASWVDGAPAAVERDGPTGCVRSIAIPVDTGEDLPSRPEFRRLAAALHAPCGADVAVAPAGSERYLWPPAERSPRVSSAAITAGPAPSAPLSTGLLALALTVMVVEVIVRRRPVRAHVA